MLWLAARYGSFMSQKGSGVKFGLADPGKMAALAQHAEDCGFESFYVSEHIVLYPGSARRRGDRRATAAVGGRPAGVGFDGEFFAFESICIFPKPYNARTLPIHVGRSSKAAAVRAGRRGDGYFPGGRLIAEQRAGQIEIMRTAAIEAGRDADALEYTRWGLSTCPKRTLTPMPKTGLRGWSSGPPPVTRATSVTKSPPLLNG